MRILNHVIIYNVIIQQRLNHVELSLWTNGKYFSAAILTSVSLCATKLHITAVECLVLIAIFAARKITGNRATFSKNEKSRVVVFINKIEKMMLKYPVFF